MGSQKLEVQHVNVKLFVEGSEEALEPLVPVFHRWIQEKPLEELLLDVADYRHVIDGPGVVLIGHEANYSLDNTEGDLGVLYNRKTPLDGTNQDRLKQAARAALNACEKLEAEPKLNGKIRFGGTKIQLLINDRFLAPNVAETRAAFDPELKEFCARLFGGIEYTASYENDPRRRFGVTLQTAQPIPSEKLLANLAS
ncbi:MAG TPA: hypothetical protein VJS43_07760 [Candidatus Acidoferrales bacterium]|nr:hypothetical protein [Candidatus Acidoferrales bacterium]